MAQFAPTLTECPRLSDSLHFATYWYRCASSFLVCTKCYREKIAHTQLASTFEQVWHTPTPEAPSTCMFGSHMESLFNNALRGGKDALKLFMDKAAQRGRVKHCPGTEGVDGSQAVVWFGIPKLKDFMACEACYVDVVCNTSFKKHFSPYPRKQGHETWACDIAMPFVRRHLELDSAHDNWAGFLDAAAHRMKQSPCDGADHSLAQFGWRTPKSVPNNMLICESHYLDEISGTPVMHEFAELRSILPNPPASSMGRCAYANTAVQICSNQTLKYQFGKWVELMSKMMYLPACRGQTTQDGDYYLFVNPWTNMATDFGFCEACYVGCIESSNNAHMFRRERVPGDGFCELSPDNPRLSESVQKLTELLFTRDATQLRDYAVHTQPQTVDQYQNGQSYAAPPAYSAAQGYQTDQRYSSATQDFTSALQGYQASAAQGYYQPAAQNYPSASQSSQQQTGTMSAAQISAKLSSQHAMNMGMMNSVFAQNSMHNAAMAGINSQGSMYNKYNDTAWTNAQYSYTQAQNQMFSGMGKR